MFAANMIDWYDEVRHNLQRLLAIILATDTKGTILVRYQHMRNSNSWVFLGQ